MEHRQVCYHSSDATVETDGVFVFDGPALHDVQRVVLGSMELPLAQATVEDQNTLYYHEGYDAVPGADVVEMEAMLEDGTTETLEVAVALRSNRVRSVRMEKKEAGARLIVECTAPHRIVDPHHRCLVASPRLLGVAGGDVPLEGLTFVSPLVFKAKTSRGTVVGGTHVYVPPAASATELCDRLTRASMSLPLHVDFRHDVDADAVSVTARVANESRWASVRSIRILDTPLGRALHLGCNIVVSGPLPIAWPPGGATCVWGSIPLRSGNYAPARVSTAALPPRRFVTQLEDDANALFVPPKDSSKLFFSGGTGGVCACAPPPGRYASASAYLDALGHAMTQARAEAQPDADEVFEVTYDAAHGNVVFQCTRRVSFAPAIPVVFALHFQHPESLDADRLGFEAQMYTGHSVYRSARAARFPELTPGRHAPLHLLRASETPMQHLCLQASPPPALCATATAMVADANGRAEAILVARTELQDAPFAHGFGEGTAVRLSALDASLPPVWCTSLVEPAAADDDACVLRVGAPAEWRAVLKAGARVAVRAEPRPWALRVGAGPRSLPARLLGFPPGTVHAVGGAPVVSPHAFDLEPPPYLLLTLSHAGGGGSVVHTFGGFQTRVFAKLVLNVQHREFGSLLRDEAPTSSHVQRFRVGLRNPDGSPYQLHGRAWSFSLVYVLNATQS